MSDRCAVKVTIRNRLGLHARPAMSFVDTAREFDGVKVVVRRGEESVDGTSIMEIMMLAATQGTEIEIEVEGSRAKDCCAALKRLVDSGFDEE